MPKICIITASESDKHVLEKCTKVLDKFGVQYEAHVASTHRAPEKVKEIVTTSKAEIFIGMAGLAAALPGSMAAFTMKPVIGVPIESKLNGLDALLSIVQMPPGAPVATVGLDRGDNAAYLAMQILAITDSSLKKKLDEFMKNGRK